MDLRLPEHADNAIANRAKYSGVPKYGILELRLFGNSVIGFTFSGLNFLR